MGVCCRSHITYLAVFSDSFFSIANSVNLHRSPVQQVYRMGFPELLKQALVIETNDVGAVEIMKVAIQKLLSMKL